MHCSSAPSMFSCGHIGKLGEVASKQVSRHNSNTVRLFKSEIAVVWSALMEHSVNTVFIQWWFVWLIIFGIKKPCYSFTSWIKSNTDIIECVVFFIRIIKVIDNVRVSNLQIEYISEYENVCMRSSLTELSEYVFQKCQTAWHVASDCSEVSSI